MGTVAPTTTATAAIVNGRACRRDGIITRLLYGQTRRSNSGARSCSWRTGSLPGRCSRFLHSLAPGNPRPAGDLDGRPAQEPARAVRLERDYRIDRRLPRALLHWPARRRRLGAQALPSRKRRPDAGGVSPLRRDGRPDPVDSAAAGAVQDFRPAGRHRGNQASAVRLGHRDWSWRALLRGGFARPLVWRAGAWVHPRQRKGGLTNHRRGSGRRTWCLHPVAQRPGSRAPLIRISFISAFGFQPSAFSWFEKRARWGSRCTPSPEMITEG